MKTEKTVLIRDNPYTDECYCMKCGEESRGDFSWWKFCPKCGREITGILTFGDDEDEFKDFEE